MLELKMAWENLSMCRLGDLIQMDPTKKYYFIDKTDEKLSPVYRICHVPGNTVSREDGWKAFKVQGVLDLSLIETLAKISSILAEEKTGISVVSTYNTDYILTREADFDKALKALGARGYVMKDS